MYYTKAHHCNHHSVGVLQTIELIKTENEKHPKISKCFWSFLFGVFLLRLDCMDMGIQTPMIHRNLGKGECQVYRHP